MPDRLETARVADQGDRGRAFAAACVGGGGGGYYFNVGCSDLIAEGKIGLAQFSELERLLNGADLVVLATGWKGQEHLVRRLFGEEIAARVGPIWGFGEDQELRNMFRRTAQPGLWFIAGGLAQCRIGSKQLALQIKAIEEGLLPRLMQATREAATA